MTNTRLVSEIHQSVLPTKPSISPVSCLPACSAKHFSPSTEDMRLIFINLAFKRNNSLKIIYLYLTRYYPVPSPFLLPPSQNHLDSWRLSYQAKSQNIKFSSMCVSDWVRPVSVKGLVLGGVESGGEGQWLKIVLYYIHRKNWLVRDHFFTSLFWKISTWQHCFERGEFPISSRVGHWQIIET